MRGDMFVQRRAGQARGQRLRTRSDAETFKEHALRGQAAVGKAGGRGGERAEIDMRGQVGGAGAARGSAGAWPATACNVSPRLCQLP